MQEMERVYRRPQLGPAGIYAALSLQFAGCQTPQSPPPLPPVRTAVVEKRDIPQNFEWLATLDGSTNAEIRPRVEGHIESVNYQEGSVVEKGTLLFTIDKRPLLAAELKARGDYEQAVAERNKARADVARYAPLAAEHAISQEELENARAAVSAATAKVRATEGSLLAAKLNLDFSNVRAPISGIAGIAQTRVGSLVNPNQVLTILSTVDPIRASFYISEREYLSHAQVLNHINDPQYANRRYLELLLSNGKVHSERARRIIVNRNVDPTTGTLLVQALFPNPGNILRPGLFAKVRVHVGTAKNMLLVPEQAVEEIQGTYRVAVVSPLRIVEIRTVKVGPIIDHHYVIYEGLHEGESVVVAGLQNARPGQKVVVLPPESAAPADGGR